MMNLLYISRHNLKGDTGGSQASQIILRQLQEDYNVLYFQLGAKNNIGISRLIRKLINLVSFGFIEFLEFKDVLKSHDIVLLDRSTLAKLAVYLYREKEVWFVHHNVEHQYFLDNPKRLIIRRPYAKLVRIYEYIAFKLGQRHFFLSSSDLEYYQSKFSCKDHSVLLKMGLTKISQAQKVQCKDVYTIGMIGSFDHSQSIHGASSLFDLIETYESRKRFNILLAGKDSKGYLSSLNRSDIKVIPNYRNELDFIGDIDLLANPVEGGSGIKMRNRIGLEHGKIMIWHENASVGYEEFLNNDGIYVYSNKEEFHSCLDHFLNRKD